MTSIATYAIVAIRGHHIGLQQITVVKLCPHIVVLRPDLLLAQSALGFSYELEVEQAAGTIENLSLCKWLLQLEQMHHEIHCYKILS